MRYILFLLFLFGSRASAQPAISFHSLDEVFRYADNYSSVFRNATQAAILAKYTTLAAKLSQWNLQGNASLSSIDNTKLPVNYIPAQILGGPAGKYREVVFGLTYQNNIIWVPQIDILSPYAAAKVSVARINERVTGVNNLLTKKNLYESLAAAYYNILSTDWQVTVTQKSLATADTLTEILQNKLREGIARSQDVNNGIANQLATRDKLTQLELQLQQQYNTLRSLCDIDGATPVSVDHGDTAAGAYDSLLVATGHLQQDLTTWQRRYIEADLRANKRWFYPTLTAFGNLTWQQNTNGNLFDNSPWIPSSFIGLKVTLPLFPDAGKVAAVRYDRINLRVAENNFQHAVLQDSIDNRQLQLDYQKADDSYHSSAQIESLKEDSYYKNLNIYKEGVLSSTDLLNSFIDWLNYRLNTVAGMANTEYAKSKLLINNIVK